MPAASRPSPPATSSFAARANHLRARGDHEHSRVTSVELFFDLVFVFAVTQLSHGLLAHLTPLGALQIAVLTVAVWWAWIYTAWVTNWLVLILVATWESISLRHSPHGKNAARHQARTH